MMQKISVLLLAMLFSSLNIQANAKQKYTREQIQSPQIVESVMGEQGTLKESYSFKDANVLASIYNTGTKRKPQEVLLLWHQTGERFRLSHKIQGLPGETFDKPMLFQANNLRFLNIPTEPAGSGGFVADMILWLAPDGTIHEVAFDQASVVYEGLAAGDEVIITGGEKEFFYQDEQMKFQFWIARQGDPHCCPSGGAVTGTYKLIGGSKYDSFRRRYEPDFKILIEEMQRVSAADAAEIKLVSQ